MMKLNINKLPKSEVEIEGELEAEIFEAYFPKVIQKIGANFETDGFRKGKVPESIIISKVGEMSILEEMAEMALSENYSKILEDEKIDAIGRPEIAITKIARNNPLGFKIRTAVLPEVKLPDYKAKAKKVLSSITEKEKNIEVTEEELESTITDIRKSRAPKVHIKESAEILNKEDGVEEKDEKKVEEEKKVGEKEVEKEGEKEIEEKEKKGVKESEKEKGGKEANTKAKNKETRNELPELNDEFVRSLGPFKDVADFKEKLKENIKLEKENQLKEATRLKIMEEIIEKTEVDIPEILIESETEKILYKMESDISAMGLKFEDYLAHIKKTKEDLKKDFRKDAEKKAKFSLVMNKIIKEEDIKADEEEASKEIAHLLEHYKDADPERVKMHVENVLTNEKVFNLLENL